jgi:hypothetical protein
MSDWHRKELDRSGRSLRYSPDMLPDLEALIFIGKSEIPPFSE